MDEVIARGGLLALAMLAPGCLIKPDRVAATTDGGVDAADDGSVVDPAPRTISTALWTMPFGGTPGMSHEGYSIPTAGIHDGDLVLFFGSIDNGSDVLWPGMISAGFHQINQTYFGFDGQTFVSAWKIAAGEPASYAGTYGQGNGSGAAILALIAIAGPHDGDNPFDTASTMYTFSDAAPIQILDSYTTMNANDWVIYAAATDWSVESGGVVYEAPLGFTPLIETGDISASSWDWGSMMIDSTISTTIRTRDALGTFTGTHLAAPAMGRGIATVIAVPRGL